MRATTAASAAATSRSRTLDSVGGSMSLRPLVLIGCLASLLAAPSGAAAQATGTIAGRVTAAGQEVFSVRVGVYRAATGLADARLISIVDVEPSTHEYTAAGL